VDAVEAAQVVRPFIGGAERVQVLDRRNVLTVIGGPAEIRAVDKFLQILDVPDFAAKRVIIYGPRYVSAEGMLTLLQNLPQQLGLNTSEGKRQIEAALIGGTRRLVIVADSAGSREAILRYIDQVDTPTAHPRQVFFYSLRNQTAEDLRNALTALLPGIIPDPAEITLVANTPSNALMISATADQYYELRKIIDRLDYRIPSVMIDATIVEVQLNDSLAYGVEWFLRGREGDLVNTAAVNLGNPLNIPSPVPGQIKLLSSQWDSRATLNLLASETNLRVLSRPRILVKNRSTATIKSIDQVRVLKSVLTTDVTVGGSNIPRREFEEKDVGITLQVTPRIAEDGSINMNVKIEDSRQGANDTSSGESQPTFNVREVNTELLSQNGQTILIGGLIKNNLSRERQKIPFFGNLPLIGDAFRNLADENQRTELIVFLTPYLASDEMSAKLLSEAVSNMAMLNPDMARNAEAPGLYLGSTQPTAVEAPPPPAPKPAKAVRKSAPRPLETPRNLPAPPDALPESSLNMPEQTPPAPPPSPDITAEDRYQPRSPGSPRGRPTLAPAPAQAN
ncbi:MAG: secretin N-terminal domain-containing protein, partial [Dongiaceae bacterium]